MVHATAEALLQACEEACPYKLTWIVRTANRSGGGPGVRAYHKHWMLCNVSLDDPFALADAFRKIEWHRTNWPVDFNDIIEK